MMKPAFSKSLMKFGKGANPLHIHASRQELLLLSYLGSKYKISSAKS